MKYVGMPLGMWALFSQSFCCQLTAVFGYDKATAKAVTQKAKPKYIRRMPVSVSSCTPQPKIRSPISVKNAPNSPRRNRC